MKRGRISERKGIELEECSHILINYSGSSFSDLPRDIMVNVLLRLSVKRIVVCKLVCKTWHDLISAPKFAKLHFDQAQAYPLIQMPCRSTRSRILYLVQPEEEDFELKFEMCDHIEHDHRCDCHIKFEVDTKLKLPLRNLQMVFDGENSGQNMLDRVIGAESDSCIKLKMKDHKYRVVNSCNGLLCLSNPSGNEPLVVCNPVTGEFINLPGAKNFDLSDDNVLCGLGFSPETSQYKVIRIFRRSNPEVKFINGGVRAEVHTLGTDTWRDIECFQYEICGLQPTYLNGFLYWPYGPDHEGRCLISFDIENERFGSIPPPPMEEKSGLFELVDIGISGGELSVSCCFLSDVIEVWVMKHYGTTNVWSKVFSIDSYCDQEWPKFGHCQPIKYLNDGALLMFDSNSNCLIYKHPKTNRFRYFRFGGTKAQLQVIAHTPSFVSLKDALLKHDVEVLNVNSRCAKLKLQNENTRIFLMETDVWTFR